MVGRSGSERREKKTADAAGERHDPLTVRSVEKAFRVLAAFSPAHPTLSLTEIAKAADLDKSAAQRFAHTLTKLGYMKKNENNRRLELTSKTLTMGSNYVRSNTLITKSIPYLLHLSRETEETINLTVLDGTDIIFVSRFLSRHVLANDVVVGAKMPAFCTAPGIAMLSRMAPAAARAVLEQSDLKPYTASTTYMLDALIGKIEASAAQGYATAFEEFYHGDLSIAAAVLDAKAQPLCAFNISVSSTRYTPEEAKARFAPLVVAAAASVSQNVASLV
ncbi:IclR family transcriptional regulator [Bosea sp. (in: a-proteobacteria)]|uniref:IclR family transcriptional regulator n=1 Tax=Bosea sp. (in: a-proteobacteria) TaxID=1871050 RepID=UPI00262492F2|nr:IclR family transcriptional regulator C-terminal domain-containing protein [Bosea sp. (in: a-proteobacteria)]MCO5091321.1 IclR family transcriptional regulator [Bosea sp. (in: a-proteobacteria)]